jgi:RNA polymerase sigma-70 factor (ECF subfamily)
VSSRADAEDLTQQTFERALRARERYDSSQALPRTWLIAIARNLLIDHFRRDRSGQSRPLDDDHEGDRRLPVAEGDPQANLGLDPELEGALSRLSSRDRELIALRFGGDLNGPEIAEITGMQLAAVQQALSRALRRIRTELDSAEAPQPSGLRPSP